MAQNIPNLYPPLSPTVAEETHISEHWNDDALFQTYLFCLPDPTHDQVMETGRIHARVKCSRARIRDLNILRKQILPRQSSHIDNDLAKEKFRRKVLAWQMFRVNELPAELLVEIFRYVVLSTHVMRGEATQKLRLTWVCRRFREVAIGDGVLWGRILFTDPAPWPRSLTFFERAAEAPLDICINDIAFPKVLKINHQQVMHLVQVLETKAHNIRSLIFSLNDWLCPWFALKMFEDVDNANKLELLQVDRGWDPYLWSAGHFRNPDSRVPIALLSGNTPSLKTLILNGMSINWDTVNTANLRALDIRRLTRDVAPTVQQFRALLQAPNLMKLYLHSAIPRFDGPPLIEPVFVPNLRELRLGDMSCQSVMNVLRCIHAPEVRILALLSMTGTDYTPVFEMLTGRFPDTQVLELASVQVEDSAAAREHVMRWFDSMPYLRVLKVESMQTPALFHYLLEDPQEFRDSSHPYSEWPYNASPSHMHSLNIDLRTLVTDKIPAEELAFFAKEREEDLLPLAVVTIPEQK